jgi:hypothetical protein
LQSGGGLQLAEKTLYTRKNVVNKEKQRRWIETLDKSILTITEATTRFTEKNTTLATVVADLSNTLSEMDKQIEDAKTKTAETAAGEAAAVQAETDRKALEKANKEAADAQAKADRLAEEKKNVEADVTSVLEQLRNINCTA